MREIKEMFRLYNKKEKKVEAFKKANIKSNCSATVQKKNEKKKRKRTM
jgi:hypothetical protein